MRPERAVRAEESDALVALLSGGLRVGALAQIVDVESANVARTLRSLTAKGFVERRPDESDRRATIVELTPSGREIAQELKASRDLFIFELLRRFPGRKRVTLIATLEELGHAVRDVSEELTRRRRRG